MSSAARTARAGSSSCTTGAPNSAITPSPVNTRMMPPCASTAATISVNSRLTMRTSRRGSVRSAMVVKPRTSWKRIVTSRRSPSSGSSPLSTAAATSRETKRPKVSLMRSRSSSPATISLNERARKPISSSRRTLRRWAKSPSSTRRMAATSSLQRRRDAAGDHGADDAARASSAAAPISADPPAQRGERPERACRTTAAPARTAARRAAPRSGAGSRAAARRRAGRRGTSSARAAPAPARAQLRVARRLTRPSGNSCVALRVGGHDEAKTRVGGEEGDGRAGARLRAGAPCASSMASPATQDSRSGRGRAPARRRAA